MATCKLTNLTTSNYPNLLEVYTHASGEYLVVDRTLGLESYYEKTIYNCLKDLTDTIPEYRNLQHKYFHSYYYQGNHYTLAELQQHYPELLL